MASEQDIGRLVVELLLKDDNFKKGLKDAAKESKSFGDYLESGLGAAFDVIQSAAVAAGAALAATGAVVVGLGAAALKTGSEFESYEARLTTLMGSASAAEERMKALFQVASTTPFNLDEVVNADVTLQAFGASTDENLQRVLDLAGAMGTDLTQAAIDFGKAWTQGAGGLESDAGRAVRAMIEARAGVNATSLSIEEFRAVLMETLDQDFAGGADRLSQSYQGAISNIEDSWTKFTKQIADAGLFDGVKAGLRGVLDLMGRNEVATARLAQTIGVTLTKALIEVVKLSGDLVDLGIQAAIAWNEMLSITYDIQRVFGEFIRTVIPFSESLLSLGDKLDPVTRGFLQGLIPGLQSASMSAEFLAEQSDRAANNADRLRQMLGAGSREADRLAALIKIGTQRSAFDVEEETKAETEATKAVEDNTKAQKDNEKALRDRLKAEQALRSDLMDLTEEQRTFSRLLFEVEDAQVAQMYRDMADGFAEANIPEQAAAFADLNAELRAIVDGQGGNGQVPWWERLSKGLAQAATAAQSFASNFRGVVGQVQSVIEALTGTSFSLSALIAGAGGADSRTAARAFIDELVGGAVEFAQALAANMGVVVKGLVDNLGALEAAVTPAAEAVIRAIAANLPKLILTVIDQTRGISEQLVPVLLKAVVTVIGRLPDFLVAILRDTGTVIIPLLTKELPALIEAIARAIPDILAAVIETAPQITIAFTKLIVTLAFVLVRELTLLIPDLIVQLVLSIREASRQAEDALAAWLAGGIRSSLEGTRDALRAWFADAIARVFNVDDQGRAFRNRFNDTPGAIRAGQRGLVADFAPGDYVVAAQSPSELLRQAVALGAQTPTTTKGARAPGSAPPTIQRTALTIMAEGRVLDQALLNAGQHGRAPTIERLMNGGAGVQVGFDQGGFALQTP